MKKSLVVGLVGLVILSLFVGSFYYFYSFFTQQSLETFPLETVDKADTLWRESMLDGIGAYVENGERGPAISDDKDSYREDPRQAIYGKSGIVINSALEKGGYMRIEGGPIDIVEGPVYEYVLYGRIVGRYYTPHWFSWDNAYRYSHSDYYLLKRNKGTDVAVVLKDWKHLRSQYGSLQFDEATKILHVKFCSGADDAMPVDVELNRDEKMPIVQCTGEM